MDATLAAVLGGCLGLVIGAVAVAASRFSERTFTTIPPPTETPVLPAGVGDVLAVLRSIAIVLDTSDAVVNNSASAVSYGLVRHGELVHAELRQLARQARRDGEIREVDLELSRGFGATTNAFMRARVAPLGALHILILAEDHTHAQRVEEVRRDFVANVSHELKTPVGGISLLAEAILDAVDDPEAVARFAGRIATESTRLTALVSEIVELSRLQAQEDVHRMSLVDVSAVTHEAIEATRTLAEGHDITFVQALEPHTCVYGDATQLRTAVANLLTNAVNYSAPHTRVAISVRTRGVVIEVAVADQGRGIAPADLQRIFERFYRVDTARSRATGGTGLGLAIVKHICANHGGEVTVWSSEGYGSTFTIRLPTASHSPVPDHSHCDVDGIGSSAPDSRTHARSAPRDVTARAGATAGAGVPHPPASAPSRSKR